MKRSNFVNLEEVEMGFAVGIAVLGMDFASVAECLATVEIDFASVGE